MKSTILFKRADDSVSLKEIDAETKEKAIEIAKSEYGAVTILSGVVYINE